MPVYPQAHYRPLNEFSDGDMRSYRGAVLHVNQSDSPSLYNWIAGNHNVSCHFQVAKDGGVEQYIDTTLTSWCQSDGNKDWISIETQGFDTEPLTDAQVKAIAGILTWLKATHKIALQLADTPAGTGFGWHGMGGAAWGGHTGCPGNQRKAQRQQILDLANGAAKPTTQEDDSDMPCVIFDLTTPARAAEVWGNVAYPLPVFARTKALQAAGVRQYGLPTADFEAECARMAPGAAEKPIVDALKALTDAINGMPAGGGGSGGGLTKQDVIDVLTGTPITATIGAKS